MRVAPDAEYLRAHYAGLNDGELERLFRTDLVPQARTLLEAEMKTRGIVAASPDLPTAGEPASTAGNPYATPRALLVDPNAVATIAVSGLVRLFQAMAVASALIGLFLFFSPLLPLPISDVSREVRGAAGADALALGLAVLIAYAMQPLWILSAIGLCFFKWWARPLFAGTYALGAIQNLIGGMAIWLPWEAALVTVVQLLDGAVMVLAFLPPLSAYFAQDRTGRRA